MVQRILAFFRAFFSPRENWSIRRGGKVTVQKSRPFQILGFRGPQ